MRKRSAAGSSLLAILSLSLAPFTAGAVEAGPDDAEINKTQKELADQTRESRSLAHKMMGHVNLASLALDVNLNDEALNHVKKARKIANQLLIDAPQITSSTQFKYGKLSYKEKDESKNYYVPVIDDVFLLSDYRETHRRFRAADFEELDAGVMEVTISADLREVEAALAQAETKIGAKEFSAAATALTGIFKNAITDERVVTDPVWAVHDNLALAHNLIDIEQYDNARLALEHVKKRLSKLEKDGKNPKANQEFKTMHEQVTKLQAELRKKDPTLREGLSDRFSKWMDKIGSWYSVGYVEPL